MSVSVSASASASVSVSVVCVCGLWSVSACVSVCGALPALHDWLQALVGLQDFKTTLDMRNCFLPGPLLKLRWYDALAEQLVQRDVHMGCTSLVIGSRGSGKSMSRNHIARHILETTRGPVAIVFTAALDARNQCDIVVVSREGGRGAPVLARAVSPSGFEFVRRFVHRFEGGNVWCLADGPGEVARGIRSAHHVGYFTRNNVTARWAVDTGVELNNVGIFWVPKPQLEEPIAWFELARNDSKPAK